MATNVWDAISGVAGAVSVIASTSAKPRSEPAYNAEVTKTQSYGEKQGSNTLMYVGLGGMVFLLIIMMSMRK